MILFHLIAFFLFSRGFLLTKIQIEKFSEQTSPPAQFNKAVIVMVDALRFDFCYSNQSLQCHNKLNFLTHLLETQPLHSLLFKSIADPPTTTSQRLKAITSGGLPTFIDAGSNFGAVQITDDNFIHQLNKSIRNIKFMGDETWSNLFPTQLTESYPFPSFDVWDLHTLDNQVLELIYPALAQFDILIAHFLGVDHAGHRYGPDTLPMAQKLDQMDHVFKRIYETMDDETILFIMGDHGMDEKGDHGGASVLEVTTSLFAYSKKPLISNESLEYLEKENLLYKDAGDSSFLSYRTIQQIDFTSTFSVLMGIPIPYGNLGFIIPEFFASSPFHLVKTAHLNSKQLSCYLNDYIDIVPDSQLQSLAEEMNDIINETQNAIDNNSNDSTFTALYKKQVAKANIILETLRSKWSQFNLLHIFYGIGIMFIALVVGYFKEVIEHPYFTPFVFLKVDIASVFIFPVLFIYMKSDSYLTFEDVLFQIALLRLLIELVPSLINSFSLISTKTQQTLSNFLKTRTISFRWFINTLITILYLIIPASDSFSIQEDSAVTFLLQTLTLSHLFTLPQNTSNRYFKYGLIILIMLITRILHHSTICRVEQSPFCFASFYMSATSSVSSLYTLPIMFISYLGIYLIQIMHFDRTKSLINRILLGSGYLICFMYWTLDTMQSHSLYEQDSHIKPHLIKYLFLPLIILYTIHCYSTQTFSRKTILSIFHLIVSVSQKPIASIIFNLCFLQMIVIDYLGINLWVMLISLRLFFSTGHQFNFSSIQWDTAFIGQTQLNYLVGAFLVFLNTFGPSLFVYLFHSFRSFHSFKKVRDSGLVLNCFITMICCFVLRNHHKILVVFTPRMMYGWMFFLFVYCLEWVVESFIGN